MDKLNKNVEDLRKELDEHVLEHSLLDPKTIELSQELDKFIVEKQKEKLRCK